jgi:hypothetical protein
VVTESISDKPMRSWESKADDSQVSCFLHMQHRITVRELLDHFAEHYPHVDMDSVQINYATAKWMEQPTEEELEERAAGRARWEEHHEAWERRTLAELKEKYESGEKT